jgi:hypothetical protein
VPINRKGAPELRLSGLILGKNCYLLVFAFD